MHKLVFAQQSRCPKRNRRLVLPDELPPVADELTAYGLGKSNTYVLSRAEETLLYQRYVQLSTTGILPMTGTVNSIPWSSTRLMKITCNGASQ